MKYTLTDKDIKELRFTCRMGYLIPSMLILIMNLILFGVVMVNELSYSDSEVRLALGGIVLLAVLIGFFMNRKYIADIRNQEKVVETGTIQSKEKLTDFESGSGSFWFGGRRMNEFDRYNLIVDNVRHRVDKEFYDQVEEGMKVDIFYAPESRLLLSIELHKSRES